MATRPLSLQDQFLNSVRRAHSPVTIFLVKGVKLQGVITWFDTFSLLLRRNGSSQLVYKHAVSTIMPQEPPEDLEVEGLMGHKGRGKPALQDIFLAAAAREQGAMTIFLVNGVMLQGTVAAFDQFSLLLERTGQVQLVYKHAVSTLQSAEPLSLDAAGDEQPEAASE